MIDSKNAAIVLSDLSIYLFRVLAITTLSYQIIPDHVGWSIQYSRFSSQVTFNNSSSLKYVFFYLSSRKLHLHCHFLLAPVYGFPSSHPPYEDVLQNVSLIISYLSYTYPLDDLI